MGKPPVEPNGKIIYFIKRDLEAVLKRPEKGLIKHYISNLIEMKKRSYFERELLKPIKTANKNTLTKFYKAYEELEVLNIVRTKEGMGLELPYYYPENENEWLIVQGGYFRLNVEEFKKAMESLPDNAFRVFVKQKLFESKNELLTVRKLKKLFGWCLKTIKSALSQVQEFFQKLGQVSKKKEVKSPQKPLDLISEFNEKVSDLKRKKREKKSDLSAHNIPDVNLKAFDNLIDKGKALKKEVQIGMRRFSEYFFSNKRENEIKNPGAYLYKIMKETGQYVPPEGWILGEKASEKGVKMVPMDTFFEEKSREEEEDFNFKKKKALDFLNNLNSKAV